MKLMQMHVEKMVEDALKKFSKVFGFDSLYKQQTCM